MATRFYFPNSVAAAVSPNVSADWGTSVSLDRIALARSHRHETAATKAQAYNGAVPAFWATRQFVSEPLCAQTISGTVKGQLRGLTSNAAKLGSLAVAIRIVQNDGTDYGTPKVLLAPSAGDAAATPPYLAASLTNRQMNDAAESASITLTSQTAVEGDRLVIELGFRDTTAHASRTLGLSFGGTTTADLAEDNTTTTAEYPWIEFSGAVLLQPCEYPRITDTVTAELESADKSRSVTEGTVKLTDTPTAVLDPLVPALLSETVKITDTPTAARGLTADVAEAVKVSETVTAIQDQLASVSETVRIADTVTAALDVLAVQLTESVKIIDLNQGVYALIGVLRITDTVTAVMEGGVVDLSREVTAETLRLTDTAAATLDPLQATGAEAVTVTDTVTAARGLEASATETVRLTDTASAVLDPLQASAAETLRIADTVDVGGDLAASATETVHLTDTVAASLSHLETSATETVTVTDTPTAGLSFTASADEALRLSDAVTAVLSPLLASATETLVVTDTATAARDLTASTTETVRLTDTATAARDLTATATETLRLTDTVTAVLTLGVVADETLRLADTVTAALDHLEAALVETVTLSEALTAVRAAYTIDIALVETVTVTDTATPYLSGAVTRVILLAGVYAPTVTVAGADETTVTLAGSYTPTVALAGTSEE